ncbi:hypothetical protein ONZ43_g5105 [Nemania bipapillata]|uniref:Uncharacterized protein n=1 Tax=Nemania bipapillata TaxID=110536 RepID=A0ACC2IEU1_9PEZI|nr:hypothetical protein ONZ43_g5105 [Nemania bipapillata]
MGDEFGFNDLASPPLPLPASTIEAPGRVRPNVRAGEVVSAGAVHHIARPRVSSLGRQTSYEAVLGVAGAGSGPVVLVTTPPEDAGLRRGKSLNLRSVPEAREEEDRHAGVVHSTGGGRRRAVSESQQALLGGDEDEGVRGGRVSPVAIERVEGLEEIELESRKRRRDS